MEWKTAFGSPPAARVGELVQAHRRNTPDLEMAIWLNPTDDPAAFWQSGIDLLEVAHVAADEEPEFRPIEFGPSSGGWPALRLILTSAQELMIEEHLEVEGKRPDGFVQRVRDGLRSGRSRIVYSRSGNERPEAFDTLLTPSGGFERLPEGV